VAEAVSSMVDPDIAAPVEPEPLSDPKPMRARRRDPLGPVFDLGVRATRVGMAVGLFIGSTSHGVATAAGLTHPLAVGGFAERVQRTLRDRMRLTYDVDMEKLHPPPQPDPPKPDPPESPKERAEPTQKADQPQTPPPAAEAAKVLTANADPDEPLDLTGNTFVTGNGEKYVGGTTTSNGTAKKAVYDPNARGSAAPPPPPPPKKVEAPAADLSRPPMPSSQDWGNSCPWPAEADQEQIDYAVVVLAVTVGPDGRAVSVSVQTDPGHGFGASARRCAMGKQYTPGLDSRGQPVTKTTPPIRIRFTR
jgi:periplasmic protein TonB